MTTQQILEEFHRIKKELSINYATRQISQIELAKLAIDLQRNRILSNDKNQKKTQKKQVRKKVTEKVYYTDSFINWVKSSGVYNRKGELNKKELHKEYEAFSQAGTGQRFFTTCLENYANEVLKMKVHARRSNGKSYISFS